MIWPAVLQPADREIASPEFRGADGAPAWFCGAPIWLADL